MTEQSANGDTNGDTNGTVAVTSTGLSIQELTPVPETPHPADGPRKGLPYGVKQDKSGEEINAWDPVAGRWTGQGEYHIDPVAARGGTTSPARFAIRRCTGTLPAGARCPRKAMGETDYCYRHGVNAGKFRLVDDGRYTRLLGGDQVLLQQYIAFLDDPDITDVRAELALQRVLLGSALAQIADSGATLAELSGESLQTITALNLSVAKLAEVADKILSKPSVTVTIQQMEWFVEQLLDAVWNAVGAEIPYAMAIPETVLDEDGATVTLDREDCAVQGDQHIRSATRVRSRILERIADAVEAAVVPRDGRRSSSSGFVSLRPASQVP